VNGRSPSPHAAASTGPIPPLHASGIPTSLNITDMGIDVIPIDKTDAIYSGHLAQVEHGVQFMNGPIPHWIQDHVVHTSPVPVWRLVMHQGNGQSTNGGAVLVPPATSDAISGMISHSPSPTHTHQWMRTHSKSHCCNVSNGSASETKSGSEMHPGGTMAEMPQTWKQKGQLLNMETPTDTDHGHSIKKPRSKK